MGPILIQIAKVVLVLAAIDAAVYGIYLLERRFAARAGSSAGGAGLMQPMARFFKLLYKDDSTPEYVDRVLYTLAPLMALLPAALAIAVMPFGTPMALGDASVDLQLAGIDGGVLFVLTMSIFALHGLIYGAFASNNKYALLGGLRASATLLATGAVYALAIVSVVMLAGSMRLDQIVAAQGQSLIAGLPRWNLWMQPVAFLLFVAAAAAASGRRPFDVGRSGTELVTGYATEYGGIKLALFSWAESVLLLTNAMLVVLLFLGGWQLPLVDGALAGLPALVLGIVQVAVFAIKVAIVLAGFAWLRWSIPRFRHDQVTRLGWKVLIPLILINIAVTGIVMAL